MNQYRSDALHQTLLIKIESQKVRRSCETTARLFETRKIIIIATCMKRTPYKHSSSFEVLATVKEREAELIFLPRNVEDALKRFI